MYHQKGAFSDVNFFKPIFESLQKEMNAESARVVKATDLGRKSSLLEKEHQKVLAGIEALSEYCLNCKPKKKKKRKS